MHVPTCQRLHGTSELPGRPRMAVLNKSFDAAAELGRNSASKHQIQPEYGDEQADAGRDCRTGLARPNSQARKYQFSLFS